MNLYELYEGNELLGEYTAKQIEEITGYKRNHVSCVASTGTKINSKKTGKKYRVERADDRALCKKDLPLLIEFEDISRKILDLFEEKERKERKRCCY